MIAMYLHASDLYHVYSFLGRGNISAYVDYGDLADMTNRFRSEQILNLLKMQNIFDIPIH